MGQIPGCHGHDQCLTPPPPLVTKIKMQYPIQTLHIILLHILCPNHHKYVGLRRGSLDNVFDYEKGEVNCQNEITRNSDYWLRAMCMDEKRYGRKSKLQYCNLPHLMTVNRKALFERTSVYVVLVCYWGRSKVCHPFPDFHSIC